MIKVLIADDSSFMRKMLSQMISDPESGISVIDTAGDGKEAVEKTVSLKPDVVLMDIIMPGVDGVWALEEIMKQNPTPVIIISSIAEKSSDIITEAFNLGVVETVMKPDNPNQIAFIKDELIAKVKSAAAVNKTQLLMFQQKVLKPSLPLKAKAHQCVVIATSAGGPVSLYAVISGFSDSFYGGVVVAQHMPAAFLKPFSEHIQRLTTMKVKIAEKGDILFSRRVLFSPTTSTLELCRTKKGAVVNLTDCAVRLQPVIDKTIISCAETFKASTVLVVLSGLGSDGVKGAEVVKRYGGKVIVEDSSTAGVYSGMPLSVVKSGYHDALCPSYAIAGTVESYLKNVYTPKTNTR